MRSKKAKKEQCGINKQAKICDDVNFVSIINDLIRKYYTSRRHCLGNPPHGRNSNHLLNPDFDSWDALERAAIEAVVEPLFEDGTLDNDTWGESNRLAIRHPMAGALPPVDWWLSMPDLPMSGDGHMPRVQRPVHGASERFGVTPGREEAAFFHMATGQSAHPLSPFFGNGHEDWVEGRFSPWLAGETRYRLTLRPPED